MEKTNVGLVEHCEKALREKWYYLWGDFGRVATQTLIDNNIRQYPTNEKWRSYLQKAIGKTRVCDCYGLVKSYLWWVDDYSNPKYNAVQDTNTAGAYNRAIEKGSLATLPEISGVILYMQGHVGVYMGHGRFIELMGNGIGAFEGRLSNGKVISGSRFTHWFKDINIKYITDEKIKDIEEVKEMRYNTIDEVPEWGRVTIQKLINRGYLNGNGNSLNLSEDMVRMLVINDRAGTWNKGDNIITEEVIYYNDGKPIGVDDWGVCYEEIAPVDVGHAIVKKSNGFLGIFNATGYNLSFESTNKTPESPAYGITASGFNLRGHTRESAMVVATDQSIIPFGTRLFLVFNKGYEHLNGVYTSQDTGKAIRGDKIDIFMGEDISNEAVNREIGRQDIRVYLLS